MMFWVGVIITFFVVMLLIEVWQYVLAGALVIGGIWLAVDQMKKAKIAAQKVEAERAWLRRQEEERVAAQKAAQQNYQAELVKVSDGSLQTFEALPKQLMDAEALLDQAEQDFKEGAFAPFWDSVEQATLQLGRFDGGIAQINHNLKRYGELSKVYEAKVPRFPIVIDSVMGMVAGNTTADRMKAIVRQAQRNFQFSSIYEQRKTNQILIAGFTNLAQALDGMGRRISESIDELSTQVSEMSSSLNASMASLGEQMATVNQSTVAISESVQGLQSSIEKDVKEQSERHDRALEMLENIQRRRIPADFRLKDLATKPAP